MREKAFLFGAAKSLLAITTEPPPEASKLEYPAVILVNAGLIYRVGPNRLYVKLARTLAAAGFPVMRFDLSGVGDSGTREDTVPIKQRAIVEVQQAMNCLNNTRGISRFVVIGLCSGADDAFRVALVDSRVVGIAMIDPCMYASNRYYFYSYSKRLLKFRSWVNLITVRSDLWRRLKNKIVSRFTRHETEHSQDWEVIPLEEFRPGLTSLVDRGVKLLLIYSDNGSAYYNYRVHVGDKLQTSSEDAAVRTKLVDNSDHVFTRLCHQESLIHEIDEWARGLAQPAESQPKGS